MLVSYLRAMPGGQGQLAALSERDTGDLEPDARPDTEALDESTGLLSRLKGWIGRQ